MRIPCSSLTPVAQLNSPSLSRTRPTAIPCRCLALHSADIRTWHANIEQHASEGVNKILIGNKSDWTEKRAVTEEQGRELANELGIKFMETSAKINEGVEEAFFTLARCVMFPHSHSSREAWVVVSGAHVVLLRCLIPHQRYRRSVVWSISTHVVVGASVR